MNTPAVTPSAMGRDAVAVSAEEVSHTFANGVRALDSLTLKVAQGEFVSLIGPSGCGKSTLLRIVAGLETPSVGRVAVSGGAKNADIGFVFQSATLMPWTTVARNVELPLQLRGIDERQAKTAVGNALRRVGLSDFSDAYPRELSGGMQMRTSIARALVTEPSLLLLDEPFGALDEITRERLDQDLLNMWREHNLTVLFVTHSVYEAAYLSSRVLVMSARPGKIVAEIAVPEPQPRSVEYRTSARFAVLAQQISHALVSASAERGS